MKQISIILGLVLIWFYAWASYNIPNGGVTNAKLANGAVTNAKMASNSVDTAQLVDNAVTTAKITDANVTAGKLASDSVTTVKILNSNVTTAKIADSNVTTAKIADLNVTTGKINDLAVTTGKIADSAVTGVKTSGGVLLTNSTGGTEYRVEMFQVSSVCGSNPCTITRQSGTWITSVARNSLGNYSANIQSGIFSAPPSCIGIAFNGADNLLPPLYSSVTASVINFQVRAIDALNKDAAFQFICMGAR